MPRNGGNHQGGGHQAGVRRNCFRGLTGRSRTGECPMNRLIIVMAFQSADQGTIDLDERVQVRRSDFRTGTGVLQYHDPGTSLTVRDLITQMIITSDNTATHLVIEKLGGRDRVNQWLADNKYV